MAGTSTSAIATIPAVVPAPSSASLPASPLIRRTSIQLDREPWVVSANTHEDRDHDDVVDDGRERGRDEPPVRVEQRGGERGEAVEQHLGQEPQREDGHHVQLGGAFGSRGVERVEPRDQRREQPWRSR